MNGTGIHLDGELVRAVRLSDDETGKPLTKPATALAPASAMSSWSASTRSVESLVNARAVSMLPLNATIAMPAAAPNTPGHR